MYQQLKIVQQSQKEQYQLPHHELDYIISYLTINLVLFYLREWTNQVFCRSFFQINDDLLSCITMNYSCIKV